MKKNDVCICSSSLIPVSESDNERLVVIREIDKNNVQFSFCCDNQPNLCSYSAKAENFTFYDVKFLRSAFVVDRSFFEEFFTPVGEAVPYPEDEGGQKHE